ncbi:MAG TPA: glycosyltransferase, partial [Herpetosiphonaceae bacterium]|nr:glycosyltransferase [Herpetosiphonaceae bacterium]
GVGQALDSRGWADDRTIAAALAASDIALYPMDDTLLNRAKCSAKLTEQMQAGLPVVAARVGQVAEYIEHGASGWLVAPGDGGALARGVLDLLDQPARAASLGSAARERIETLFNWPRLADGLEAVYERTLA